MKIRKVTANNRKKAFEVTLGRGIYPMPFARLSPSPSSGDPLSHVYVDDELGREGFTWVLESGAEGSLHVDSVLDYNEDPEYMRELLLYDLTLKAQKCVDASPLSKREIMRRARTSPAQFYRLLDATNTTKSLDKLVVLLWAMDCTVELSVCPSSRAEGSSKDDGRQSA